MVNFAFVATLFSFLPSFIAVAVELDLIGQSFQKYSTEVPLIWSDGEVRLKDGKVVISLGERSTLLVYSEGKMSKYLSDMKETVELSEPNISITIITKKDKYDFGEVIDTYSPSDDVATLKTIKLDPIIESDDADNFINTDDAFNSTNFRYVSDLDWESMLASEKNGPVEDESETDSLINLFSNDTNINDIGADLLFEETYETRDQDTLNNNFIVDKDRTEVGYNPKGQQFRVGEYEEPMICISGGVVSNPQFVSSLTGKIHQLITEKLPFTGKYRIPDETKLLIVNVGHSKKYYKNITRGSKVWYLRSDEETFYPCIVQFFSRANPKPSLKCIGLESATVAEVSWNDIFPIESTELINDLGRFAVKREDINSNDLSKIKGTGSAMLEVRNTPKASKALPQKRKNNRSSNSEDVRLKERRIDEEAGVNHLQNNNDIISNSEIILPNSHVLYRNSDGTYYPCVVNVLELGKPIQVFCYTLGVISPSWDDIFPIEALSTLPKPLKIRGFEDAETVTVKDLKNFIDTIVDSTLPKTMNSENGSILASGNTIVEEWDAEDLLGFFNDDISQSSNIIGMDTLVQEMDEIRDQDIISKELLDAEVQLQLANNPKGQQFKITKFKEPMIYTSDGLVQKPQFVSSLTGKIHLLRNKNRVPFTGKYRIPDETKLLIVNEEDSKKYYKNITLGSKVWYLRRDEKTFYPCVVEIFSRANPKPTLKCVGLEPQLVPALSWDDIFPIESTKLIEELGTFAIKMEDIKWDDLSKKKETEMIILEEQKTPKASKAPLRKRKNNRSSNSEDVRLKERRIDEEAGVNHLQNNNDIISNSEIILPNSHVLYRNSDGTYYPCVVNVLELGKPIQVFCYTLGVISPSWDDIFPIEALSTLPKPLKIRGFEDAETVTVDALEKFIDTEANVKTSMLCKTLNTEIDFICASENMLESFETDKLVEGAKDNNDQDTLSNNFVDAPVQSQLGYNLKGQQFMISKFKEPMIYISNGLVSNPQFVSSLTGMIFQLRTENLVPFTGKYRIPDETKLLIVEDGASKKYYKNITLESKLWYLQRKEKVFYPCIVKIFCRANPKPTLKCFGLEPDTVPKVSWDDIFPIESTKLIKDLGRFAIKSEDIKWDDLSKKKETKMTIPRERKKPEASLKGLQFMFYRFDEPMIYASNGLVQKPQFVSSLTGKIFQLITKNRVPFTGQYRIPDETKLLIVEDGASKKYYKNITLESKVWYFRRDGKAFYPCIVKIFSQKNPNPILKCFGLEPDTVHKVSWEDIFPIESTDLIKDLGRFAIKSEEIKWDDLSKKKETEMTILEVRKTPEAYKALPRKRKNNIKEKITRKEHCINVEAE